MNFKLLLAHIKMYKIYKKYADPDRKYNYYEEYYDAIRKTKGSDKPFVNFLSNHYALN